MRNLITDVPGVLVGAADDARLASGVSVVLFDEPAAAGIATPGGAPALRDGALLAPEMTVEAVDAFVLSGGSAFGLDASGGAMACLAEQGRGFAYGDARVPIVPGAALFDLDPWRRQDVGPALRPTPISATPRPRAPARDFALGTAGAGYGAWTYDLKGGLGSASAGHFARLPRRRAGRGQRGRPGDARDPARISGRRPMSAPANSAGSGEGAPADDAFRLALASDDPGNTTLAVVATDAAFSKAQMTRIAIMASGGLALAMRPAFGPADGDIVFAASTARAAEAPTLRDLTEIGTLAAECVARAIARGVYEATALPFPGARPSWKEKYDPSAADAINRPRIRCRSARRAP